MNLSLTSHEHTELHMLENAYGYAKKGSEKMAIANKMKSVYAVAEARFQAELAAE